MLKLFPGAAWEVKITHDEIIMIRIKYWFNFSYKSFFPGALHTQVP
jgi:hypothetical protein